MDQNNNLISKILLLNFKQNNYKFNTEIIKSLNTFYNEVCSYLQINPNNYNLYYDNKKLSLNNNNTTLSDIINPNEELFFKIIQKKTKTPYKLNLRYDTINSKENSLTSSRKIIQNALTISTNNKKPHLINKTIINNINYNKNNDNIGVIIKQIPSVKDLELTLENFNNKLNYNNIELKTNNNFNNKKGILTVLGNNSVRIDFQNEITLNEFISYISFLKYQNPYYKNIIIQKDISSIKTNIRNLSYSHKNIRSYFSNNDKYINTLENNHNNNKKININDVIKAVKQNELNNDCYHGLSLNREGENEIITDYYKQQIFLRNSSPYISENEQRILEEKENKKHFFDKHKNFVTSVGKYSMKPNFIPNYVGMTPSENPNNHEFREVDKNKWINHKGFNV